MLWTPSLHPLRPSRSAVCLAEVTNEYFDAPTPWLCCDVDASWGEEGKRTGRQGGLANVSCATLGWCCKDSVLLLTSRKHDT